MAEGPRDFKSIDSDIQDRVALFMKVGDLISQYRKIEVMCPPWEESEWNKGELNLFKFNIDMIDRVYYYDNDDCVDFDCECRLSLNLFARMAYKGRSLYFHVRFMNYKKRIIVMLVGGKAYVTFNAQVFLKAVIGDAEEIREIRAEKIREIRKMMFEDGLDVKEPTSFDLHDQWNWRYFGVPSLSFLCQLAVYENRIQLKHYNECLPVCMAKDIEQFMKVRETMEHHENHVDIEDFDSFQYDSDDFRDRDFSDCDY